MKLRKTDFTQDAIGLGVWDSLVEMAGLDPDKETSDGAEVSVSIVSCDNVVSASSIPKPTPAISMLDLKTMPCAEAIAKRTKAALIEQINIAPELLKSYIHGIETSSIADVVLENAGLRESVRIMEDFINQEALKKEISSQ